MKKTKGDFYLQEVSLCFKLNLLVYRLVFTFKTIVYTI